MIVLLTTILTAWHRHLHPVFTSHQRRKYEAIRKQESIGFDALFLGCWSTSWIETQHQYYLSIQSRRSAQRWLSGLLKLFWNVSWDMWLHRCDVAHKPSSLLRQTLSDGLNPDIQFEYDSQPSCYSGCCPDTVVSTTGVGSAS